MDQSIENIASKIAHLTGQEIKVCLKKLGLTEITSTLLICDEAQTLDFADNLAQAIAEKSMPPNFGEQIDKEQFVPIFMTIDGDYLLANQNQVMIIPSSYQEKDTQLINLSLADWLMEQPKEPAKAAEKEKLNLTYRLASTADEELVMTMMKEAAQWLKEAGSTQWAGLLQGEDQHDIKGAIAANTVYLLQSGEETAGMFALWASPSPWDLSLWLDADLASKVMYLHRLTIRRKFKGQGLGAEALQLAEKIATTQGKHCLRLDCRMDSQPLLDFYRNCGFVLADLNHETGYALFQKFF